MRRTLYFGGASAGRWLSYREARRIDGNPTLGTSLLDTRGDVYHISFEISLSVDDS